MKQYSIAILIYCGSNSVRDALVEEKYKDLATILNLLPGKRYYFIENCGLFSDLKKAMENDWVPKLQKMQAITTDILPVIWDADFFINSIELAGSARYSLCEINVSCVSPFPPGAINFIVQETGNRIRTKNSVA